MLSRKLLKGSIHNVKLARVNCKNCWALQYVFIHSCMNTLLPWDVPSETLTWMQMFLSFLWGTLFSFTTYQEVGSCSLLYNSLMAWTLVQETGKVGSFPCSVKGDPSPLLPPHWAMSHLLAISWYVKDNILQPFCWSCHTLYYKKKKKWGWKKVSCLLATNLPVSRPFCIH